MNDANVNAALDAIEAAEDAAQAGDFAGAAAWAQIGLARATLATMRGPAVRDVRERTQSVIRPRPPVGRGR